MKVISIVGKVDSRPLVYTLARALSLNGFTGIITDDGSYRRLFPGKLNIGNVSGVDISVCSHVDDNAVHSLDHSGIPYDYLLIVANDYIYPESTGIIVCHGLDRSMMAKAETEEEDDFVLPVAPKIQSDKESDEEDSKKNKGKKKQSSDDETKENDNIVENNPVDDEPHEETYQERVIRIQNENPDTIIVPLDIPYKEVQIAYAAAPKRDILGISLKEGHMSYIYNCEEKKILNVNPNAEFNKLVVKIAADPIGIDAKELSVLLSKEEGTDGKTKPKGK